MSMPRLALVPGEPAGVGPELCVRLAQQPRDYTLTVFGDAGTLQAAANLLALPLRLVPADQAGAEPGTLALVDWPNAAAIEFGQPDPRNAPAVIGALRAAAGGCLRGEFDGVVTGPVNKATINQGGIPYTGTTELLAEQAGCEVVMMLANDIVRVALLTVHVPLRAVADAITPDALATTLRIVHAALAHLLGRTHQDVDALGIELFDDIRHGHDAAHSLVDRVDDRGRRARRCGAAAAVRRVHRGRKTSEPGGGGARSQEGRTSAGTPTEGQQQQ